MNTLVLSKLVFWLFVSLIMYLEDRRYLRVIFMRALWLEVYANVAGMFSVVFGVMLGARSETAINIWASSGYVLSTLFFFCAWYTTPGAPERDLNSPR